MCSFGPTHFVLCLLLGSLDGSAVTKRIAENLLNGLMCWLLLWQRTIGRSLQYALMPLEGDPTRQPLLHERIQPSWGPYPRCIWDSTAQGPCLHCAQDIPAAQSLEVSTLAVVSSYFASKWDGQIIRRVVLNFILLGSNKESRKFGAYPDPVSSSLGTSHLDFTARHLCTKEATGHVLMLRGGFSILEHILSISQSPWPNQLGVGRTPAQLPGNGWLTRFWNPPWVAGCISELV